MKIYISLPIDTPGYDIEIQRKIAKMWQNYFESIGHTVSNPFEIYDRLIKINPNPSRLAIMTEDLTELITNDAIFFCNGWHESDGCLQEAELAVSQGLKILFEKNIELT